MEQQQLVSNALAHHPVSDAIHLDLSFLPLIYVLASHLSMEEQHLAEDMLSRAKARLTYNIQEAQIILTDISKPRRVRSELQWKGLRFQKLMHEVQGDSSVDKIGPDELLNQQRRELIFLTRQANFCTALNGEGRRMSEEEDDNQTKTRGKVDAGETSPDKRVFKSGTHLRCHPLEPGNLVVSSDSPSTAHPFVQDEATGALPQSNELIVVNLSWFRDSLESARSLSFHNYLLLTVQKSPTANFATAAQVSEQVRSMEHEAVTSTRNIANSDPELAVSARYKKRSRIADAADSRLLGRKSSTTTQPSLTRPTHLLHQTTSEHDKANNDVLPDMPSWVLENKMFSCERATPCNPPNGDFIRQLKKIRLARILTLDEIGVRAYSTSIASIAAYPHPIQSIREILALPGCDLKIARLFQEFQQSKGRVHAVEEFESDSIMKVLNQFYQIWGVGAVTAREFYFGKGWRVLDDVVEFGWKSLSRVQQIGLKFYDCFNLKMSRAEVEFIATVISKHAKRVTDLNMESIIVGGYRRGKLESGDVDVILSHRKEDMTCNIVEKIVKSLERDGWITHTLILNMTNSKRQQEPLPIHNATKGAQGFDTLDKALVVWQDPVWPSKAADLAENPKAKNPNPHRRVDIIISPWRTVGCAVAGWTSGTTFQRDLRRYVKTKGWKFDSSGVRDRRTGKWVDLEGWSDVKTRSRDMQQAERRVFDGLGLIYREPWDRCTG